MTLNGKTGLDCKLDSQRFQIGRRDFLLVTVVDKSHLGCGPAHTNDSCSIPNIVLGEPGCTKHPLVQGKQDMVALRHRRVDFVHLSSEVFEPTGVIQELHKEFGWGFDVAETHVDLGVNGERGNFDLCERRA